MFNRITTICIVAMALTVATADTQPSLIESTFNELSKDFEFYDLHREISVKLTKADIRSFVGGLIESYLHQAISDHYTCLDDDQRVTDLIGQILSKFVNSFDENDYWHTKALKCYEAVNEIFTMLKSQCSDESKSDYLWTAINIISSTVFIKAKIIANAAWHYSSIATHSLNAYKAY